MISFHILSKRFFLQCKEFPDVKAVFFKLGFTLCKAEQPLRSMELQEKEAQKD